MKYIDLSSYVEGGKVPELKMIVIRSDTVSAIEALTTEEDQLHNALVVLDNGRAFRVTQGAIEVLEALIMPVRC